MTPAEAEMKENAQLLHDNLMIYYNRVPVTKKAKFEVGQAVRLLLTREKFAKTFDDIWTTEIYYVSGVFLNMPQPMFAVSRKKPDSELEALEGKFYARELQAVADPETYKIEKILKEEKRRGGRKFLFVKWLGYNSSHNSWIPAADVSKNFVN
jgi:hypothetical protein